MVNKEKLVEKILGSKGRIRVLNNISQNAGDNITNITSKSNLNFTATDRHIKALLKTGLIQEKRYGRIRLLYPLFEELCFIFSNESLDIKFKSKSDCEIVLGKPKKTEVLYEPVTGFRDYPSEFNSILKNKVKARDNYKCVLCGKTQKTELDKHNSSLVVHHLDEDKQNCDPKNLISLCSECHGLIHKELEKNDLRIKAYNYLFKLYG